jgi:hypothetical protein
MRSIVLCLPASLATRAVVFDDVYGSPALAMRQAGRLADTMQIAHRAGLPERFDENLAVCADWDYIPEVTEQREPLDFPFSLAST